MRFVCAGARLMERDNSHNSFNDAQSYASHFKPKNTQRMDYIVSCSCLYNRARPAIAH